MSSAEATERVCIWERLNYLVLFNLHNNPFFFVFTIAATLCNGRTKAQFDSEGTGTGLWIQNGTNPITDSIKIPMTQAEADKSMWTMGSCFVSMGNYLTILLC